MVNVVNQFHQLRERRLQESTREFLARGKSVQRCDDCQLAVYACICKWKVSLTANSEFILLIHRNEVFKPTNTGRLIADVFPGNTHVFCWSRTEPDERLLRMLMDTSRRCLIVFPAEAAVSGGNAREVIRHLPNDGRVNTFILLDGTWKQSGRMFHLSRWLDNVPCVELTDIALGRYAVRKSHQHHYVSTAEAAALCLNLAGEVSVAGALTDYFQLFNQHYLATRGCYEPEVGEVHQRLLQLKQTL